jgi:uncharacterized SAM-binding protein YcdF (DUF218 family)
VIRRFLLLALAAWVVVAVLLFVVHHGDRPVRADAVVSLAGTKARLPVALRLVRAGYAPLLVVSRSDRPDALELRACAHRVGVRMRCFRAYPYSTRGEARFIGSQGWRAVDVVTSQFHVFRARIVIERCFHGRLHVVGAPESKLRLPVDMAKESAKLLYQELAARGC